MFFILTEMTVTLIVINIPAVRKALMRIKDQVSEPAHRVVTEVQ